MQDPSTCTSSASPAGSLEPSAPPVSPDRCSEGENPTTCTSSASPGPASNPKSASQQDHELTIFPSGGLTSTGVTLSNTCPLDNWLIIFQALVKSNKVKLEDLPESGHTMATALRLIDDGLYADAKLLILQSLPQQQQVVAGTLDLYGNEGDFFLMLLRPYLTSVITSTCCLNTCPLQVQTTYSLSVVLAQPSQHVINNNAFLDALDDWLQQPDSHCGRKFRSQPSQ